MKAYILICMILVISLMSCIFKKNDNAIFELSSTYCYGKCPVFDLKLYEDKILYNLIDYNQNVGYYEYDINQQEKDTIDLLLSKIFIKDLNKEYSRNTRDIQYFQSKLVYQGVSKNVYFDASIIPDEYYQFIEYIINFKDSNKLKKLDTIIVFKTRESVKIEISELPHPPPQLPKELQD